MNYFKIKFSKIPASSSEAKSLSINSLKKNPNQNLNPNQKPKKKLD